MNYALIGCGRIAAKNNKLRIYTYDRSQENAEARLAIYQSAAAGMPVELQRINRARTDFVGRFDKV